MPSRENRLKRREFLQQTVAGATLAGFTIVPRHVLGGADQTPPSEKVNIAGIGVGNRGEHVIQMMENHNLVALCDVDSRFLARASSRYEKAKTYRDFRRMLDKEDKNIDAVSVATAGHAQEWLAACKTGSPTGCHFDYSGPLTETILLGTVAYRAGQKLEWDPVNLKVTNCPEAERFIGRAYREGWKL